MGLQQLKYCKTVASTGKISDAAEALFILQTTGSHPGTIFALPTIGKFPPSMGKN